MCMAQLRICISPDCTPYVSSPVDDDCTCEEREDRDVMDVIDVLGCPGPRHGQTMVSWNHVIKEKEARCSSASKNKKQTITKRAMIYINTDTCI